MPNLSDTLERLLDSGSITREGRQLIQDQLDMVETLTKSQLEVVMDLMVLPLQKIN